MSTTETPSTTATFAAAPKPDDFKAVVDLLAELGEANRKLAAMESEIEALYVGHVTDRRDAYAELQKTVSETEAALEVIARRNPQWFAEKKNVSTPFGVVKFKASTELVAADEQDAVRRILKARRPRLLRRTIELNRDLLAELSDKELAAFGITRKPKENCTIETKVVDLGKAVKAAEKSEKAANKAAKKAAADA